MFGAIKPRRAKEACAKSGSDNFNEREGSSSGRDDALQLPSPAECRRGRMSRFSIGSSMLGDVCRRVCQSGKRTVKLGRGTGMY